MKNDSDNSLALANKKNDKNSKQVNNDSSYKKNFENENKIECQHGWPSPPGLPHRAISPTKGRSN